MKPSDGRREGSPVGRNLDESAADVLEDAGLRSRHPVLSAPEVAVRVEHEPPVGKHPAARETEAEDEVRRGVGEVRHERAPCAGSRPSAAGRLRQTRRRVPSALAHGRRAMPAIASRVFLGVAPPGGVAALRKRARQVVVGHRGEGGNERAERVQVRERRGLRAVERIQKHFAPPAGRGIDEVRHVPGGDLQSERIPGDRLRR